MKKYLVICFILLGTIGFCKSPVVTPGADLLFSDYFQLIKGKRIGLVTNHSALLSNGVHLADTLNARKDTKITALFGPEHGIRGDAPDGLSLNNQTDTKTGLHVFSLYGKVNKPTPEMLKDVDVLVFDIQDIGARFYTFISTLYYTLQAAAENNIPVVVLDRPNPINGLKVDGPIRKDDVSSFVGIAPIPIMHGMTVGELAEMFAGENMLKIPRRPDLTVVKMKGWKRNSYYDETGLKWLNPSPNMTSLETAVIYPGACLIEGTNASEGRGTRLPFLTIGAPYVKSEDLIAELNKSGMPGLTFSPVSFTPVEIANMVKDPKFNNQNCNGIKISVTDRSAVKPVEMGIKLVCALQKLYPNDFKINAGRFDRLSGDRSVKDKILQGTKPAKIISGWAKELKGFLTIRKKYLLYK